MDEGLALTDQRGVKLGIGEFPSLESSGTRNVVVLHLFGAMDRGGAEVRTVQLMKHIDHRRYRMVFGTLSGRRGSLAPDIEAAGGHVVPMRLGPLWLLTLRRVIQDYSVTVVHSHVATFSGLVVFLAFLCGVEKRIVHLRSDGDQHGNSKGRRLQRALMRLLIRLFATHIVAVSPQAQKFGTGRTVRLRPATYVIPSGLDTGPMDIQPDPALRDTLGVSIRQRLIIHVGKPGPEKNRQRAIRILAQLRHAQLDAVLAFIGPNHPDEVRQLSSAVNRCNLEGHVIFLGERCDVPSLLINADVTLLTSTREGVPGIALESCAVGTPVVASALPGVFWLAERFPLIHPVQLDDPDKVWADAILDAVKRTPTASDRQSARKLVESSDFNIAVAAANFMRIWS